VALIHERSTRSVEFDNKITQLRVLLGASVLLASLLSVLSEAPQQNSGFLVKLPYWFAHTFGGLVVMSVVTRWQQRFVPARLPPVAVLLFAGLLGSLGFAPIALWLEWFFALFGVGEADTSGVVTFFSPALIWQEFAQLAPAFVLCWMVLNIGYQSIYASNKGDVADEASTDELVVADAPTDGLMALLPPALGQEVFWLQADLNYVHVTTQEGKAMVLYSLSRAAEELGDLGVHVHRSHWVSRAGVAAVRRSGRALQIELFDGTVVPVSRRREAQVKAVWGADFARAVSG